MFSVLMNSVGNIFHEVKNYVKKVEWVRGEIKAKSLSKRDENYIMFLGSYARGYG